jgi:energy-coupling factor transporter ATP-binding protein EcfA2
VKFSFRKSVHKHNINGVDFKVMDANPFLDKFFHYKDFPVNEWWLKTILVVGAPGMGKTVVANCFSQILKNRYGNNFEACEIDDLLYYISHHKINKFINLGVVDDAIKFGIDSRGSMSSGNISLTQAYFLVRHILERNSLNHGLPPAGIFILVLVGQDIDAIDKRIKVCMDLTIFKSYNPYLEKMTPKIPDSEIGFLQNFTDEAKTYNSNFARGFALGRTMGNTYIRFRFPLVKKALIKVSKPKDFKTPEQIEYENNVMAIRDFLCSFSIIGLKPRFIKGKLLKFLNQENIKISFSVVSDLIDIEFYNQMSGAEPDELENEGNAKFTIEDLYWLNQKYKVPIYKLHHWYGKSKSQSYRDFDNYLKTQAIAIENSE